VWVNCAHWWPVATPHQFPLNDLVLGQDFVAVVDNVVAVIAPFAPSLVEAVLQLLLFQEQIGGRGFARSVRVSRVGTSCHEERHRHHSDHSVHFMVPFIVWFAKKS
jgi:hypothetical protein